MNELMGLFRYCKLYTVLWLVSGVGLFRPSLMRPSRLQCFSKLTYTLAINNGVGRHIWVSSRNSSTLLFQGLFIAQFLYVGTVCFAKFSILAMYWRLFNIEHYVKVAIYVLAAIVACWGFGIVSQANIASKRNLFRRTLTYFP